ncbi:outer membrane lipoprotein carrier protein LolA [Parachryseolinea silvisoli]|uniref:outer membrane lipoprotein carrier protein LolA n=1 Tax=Parachryseolinea silvisoli TaxID=2873601 RepID=UPI002265E77A|nr:outer membrane lipoprotein carrier protein LolA [Parachryseolinea silvisoli]MCD9014562.1 outer membrane lipoprotein carrier protein LolA [Parachryseolinea silvisoli]
MNSNRKPGVPVWMFLILIAGAARAQQYTGYKPVADLPAFKQRFATESQKVQTITADFTQEKVLTALTEKITSYGKFWFKRSNRVRIDYTKPFTYRMVMNGDKMLVRDEQKENRINVRSNKLFQQVNRIMIDCVQGTILDSKDFTSRVFENDKQYLLEMTPASKSLKEFFKTIVLVVDKKDYSVKSIEMNEPAGDVTTILFSNKTLNAAVADEVFAL